MPRCLLACLLGAFMALGNAGETSAQITGAQVRDATDITLHVDQRHPLSGDGNVGTEAAPLATIGEAARRAMANRGRRQSTTIRVHAGVYRERVELQPGTADPDAAAIVLEGAGPGGTIVSGSDLWTDWAAAGPGLWTHPWSERFGEAPLPPGWEAVRDILESNPVIRRREIVFVDGQRLRQVMSQAELHAEVGTYLVREPDAGSTFPGDLSIHVDPLVDPSRARIEVAVRSETLVINMMSNLVVRNMTFQQASSALHEPSMIVTSSRNVLIEDCRVEWNNWNGLAIFRSEAVTLQRLRANHNGSGGLVGWRVKNLVASDVTAAYNNWRGAWGGFHGWATGQKFVSLHGARFTNFQALDNEATGLWFDTDVADVTLEQAVIAGNRRGMFLEAFQGPFTMRDSRVVSNRSGGILATTAALVTLDRNRIENNADYQLLAPWLVASHEQTVETDFETGRSLSLRMEHWTLTRNVVGGGGSADTFGMGLWPSFLSTLVASDNRYYHHDRLTAFRLYAMRDQSATRTFTDWQATTGRDLTSVFDTVAPPADCTTTVDPPEATAIAAGGSGSLTVTTQAACSWTATSDSPWLTIASIQATPTGGRVNYQVAPNAGATVRTGVLRIGDRSVVIRQDAAPTPPPSPPSACLITVAPLMTLDEAGGQDLLTVTTSTPECEWTVASQTPWIEVVGPARGVGSGGAVLRSEPNPAPRKREGDVLVGGQRIRIVQRSGFVVAQPLDLDRDGSSDLLLYDRMSGVWSVQTPRSARLESRIQGNWGPGWSVAPADFDGDGATDVLLYNPASGVARRGIADAAGGFQFADSTMAPGLTVRVVDLDGDGRSDVFTYDADSGVWQSALSGASGTTIGASTGVWAVGWDVHVARLDADTRDDLVLYDAGTGRWAIARSDGAGGFSLRGGALEAGWDLYPADFDGDGISDLLLYEPVSGDWSIALTRGDQFQLAGGRWSPGWRVLVGDLSGDHAADVLLYHAETGQWSAGVSDRSGGFDHTGGTWTPGWFLRLADFDRDGRADIALDRVRTGEFYVVFTSDGLSFSYYGGHWPPGLSLYAAR